MNNKKSIIIIILILIIIFLGYFLIENNLFNNTDNNTDNNTVNNTDNISKNISFDNVNNSSNKRINSTNNSDKVKDNINNHESYPLNEYKHNHNKKSKPKYDEISADDILKRVKKGVYWDDGHGGNTQDVRLGKPYKYKDLWLVAAFDKKTGKFLGAIWVASEGGYINGPDSYSEYKDIISGKTNHKSSSNKDYIFENRSNQVIDEIPNYSERYVVARLNTNISNNQNIQVINLGDNNLDNDYYIDLNQQPNMEGGNETKLIS